MSEDELMSKITKLNQKIDGLCYERDQLINTLFIVRKNNKHKKGTESD